MQTQIVIINGGVLKRPASATREAGLALRAQGMTFAQIAALWGISRARAHQVISAPGRTKPDG